MCVAIPRFQAISQGTFDVEALSGRGFGAALRPPMGSGRSPGGGPGGKSPGSLLRSVQWKVHKNTLLKQDIFFYEAAQICTSVLNERKFPVTSSEKYL